MSVRSDLLTTTLPPSTRSRAALSPAALLGIAHDLARDAETWHALVRHERAERWFVRLALTEHFDTWLIGWHAHQGVDLHDHGGSAGALCVIDGELLETSTRRGGAGKLRETRLPTGTAHAFSPSHVHWVTNPSNVLATSVHVYSPPLSTMAFYDYQAPGELLLTRRETAMASRPDTGDA